MVYRPRTKFVKDRKSKRCSKCGLIVRDTRRCKRCHKVQK